MLEFPHKVCETHLSLEGALENYAYFLCIKSGRLIIMRDWLAHHFGVQLSMDLKGYKEISRWIDVYGSYLIRPFSNFSVAWDIYDPEWTGDYRSLNLIYDTAIFLGEFICMSYPFLSWAFYGEKPIGPSKQTKSFYRPHIVGFTEPYKSSDPLMMCFNLYRTAAEMRVSRIKHGSGAFLLRLEAVKYGVEHFSHNQP